MTGFSVSAGKVMMRSTACLISSSTSSGSASISISALTRPEFSTAEDEMRLMPSMPWMASSTRTHTASSTSAGLAPR